MSTVPVPYDILTENPASAFPAVLLRDPNNSAISYTLYPETAGVAWGRRQTRPEARITIQSWFDRNENDYYAVHFQNSPAAAASALVRGLLPSYDLVIPGALVPEGEISVYARVVRANSLQESRSNPQTVLVKTTIPGGVDREVGDSWVSGLTMRVEGLPEGSVLNPSIAASGMYVLIDKYENMRKNDEVAIFVSGFYVRHIVSPAEAAAPGPLRVFIPPSIIQSGNPFGPFQIAFKVTDVAKNVSGGVDASFPFSKPYVLNSELDTTLLDYPLFLVNNVESDLVNLGTQSNSEFTLQAFLPRFPVVPSQVVGILVVTDANGFMSTVRLTPIPYTNQRSITFPVSRELINRLGGSSFRVSFETQTASGAVLRRSGSNQIRVVAPPPLVRDYTSFTDGSLNGWLPGPAVQDGDLRFLPYQNTLNLYNNTNAANNAGVVLKKTFNNLQVGVSYGVTVKVARWIGLYNYPIVSLATNQGPLTPPVFITSMWPDFVTLSGVFTANSSTAELQFVNNQSTGVGNDYAIRDFDIVRL
ncbi:hypothetical protein GIW50_17070 [Pseudomonas syringae]|uniref:Uncharacterized protein n=1 Tax=Pseudomonas syringae TaxID=317 RepID=A0A9Q3X9W0_PSESX|nr:hypothetical protein [Pseudomonas syringae]MCF5065252.1 hypothetical protein [Pseudomonas syringae]MCF5073193.1 hypothetical protein [Pseudomonas syringae]MCF5120100.1 hypothetical protein [Pseudomonas syringae]MCF5381387.1 hypothetical protein [Pseudomonas syringae]